MKTRSKQEPLGWAFGLGVAICRPILAATTIRDYQDNHKLPESGGMVVVMNHVSHIDPLTACHFFYKHGRVPRFLAKSGLFTNKALGGFLRSAGQIPVERQSTAAKGAFDAAKAAVAEGKCVVVYPEGTLTRDPDLWPMTGKSGAARIAWDTQVPVIPIGQWGPHEYLPPYQKLPRPLPRKPVIMRVGDPVQLDDLTSQPATTELIAQATTRIMDDLTALVADIRGEEAPQERFDPRVHGVSATGNPNAAKRPRGKGKER